jgi:predicted ATPase
MRRFILTGAPGAGKTTLIQALAARGHAVVEEAATDVNAIMIAKGVAHPSAEPDFIEQIVDMQRDRRLAAQATLQFHDRSAICTLALCRFLSLPEPPSLVAELAETEREGFYARRVLFVDNLGFMTPTAVRRISFEDSLLFKKVHEEVYRELGYELVRIPRAPLDERVEMIEGLVSV